MIRGFHHFCVSVKNIDEAAPFYEKFFDAQAPMVHTLPTGVRFARFTLPDGTQLELMEPVAGNAPPRPPRTRGPGLDHLCFIVDNVDLELEHARELGGVVVGGGSRPAGKNRIGFLQPYPNSGVLIELIQLEG
jgi:methylmalonyl-CoA/ethylmalonyl-CoA epimerase